MQKCILTVNYLTKKEIMSKKCLFKRFPTWNFGCAQFCCECFLYEIEGEVKEEKDSSRKEDAADEACERRMKSGSERGCGFCYTELQ